MSYFILLSFLSYEMQIFLGRKFMILLISSLIEILISPYKIKFFYEFLDLNKSNFYNFHIVNPQFCQSYLLFNQLVLENLCQYILKGGNHIFSDFHPRINNIRLCLYVSYCLNNILLLLFILSHFYFILTKLWFH